MRVGVTVIGLVVIAVGVVLLPLPGPGWVIIFAGLAIWSLEFRWAARLRRFAIAQVSAWTAWLRRQGWPVRILVGRSSVATRDLRPLSPLHLAL